MEIGALIENVIYNELIYRGYEVYVGKTVKGEIDFIVMDGDKRSYYLSYPHFPDSFSIDYSENAM